MLIYRLEKDGFGPCQHPKIGYAVMAPEDCPYYDAIQAVMKHHIDPMETIEWFGEVSEFFSGYTIGTLRFGCPSKQDLEFYWTPKVIRALKRHGFQVVKYEVPDDRVKICPDSRQCSFLINEAKLVQFNPFQLFQKAG